MSVETLWRCSGCGRWSTAKRRPPPHKTWALVSYASGGGYYGAEPRAMVECGPFEEWTAVKGNVQKVAERFGSSE